VVTLFLAGDVMTGRGVDQILPHPGAPQLFEQYVQSALDYVALAEREHGPIARPADFSYIWGAALAELDRAQPQARIINLETAVTTSAQAWPGKGVHYRMHPANVACLSAARIDCCVLANNHVLDWGRAGLAESLRTLHGQAIRTAGAGLDRAQAAAPAVIETASGGRVLVYGLCTADWGAVPEWAADRKQSGVNLLGSLSPDCAERIGRLIGPQRRPGDLVVASIHWGGNWGYTIGAQRQAFARCLIERAQVDVVHGHSSHHALGIEVHEGKLILYGCGDLLNDYEGIAGYERFHPELALMYLPELDDSGGRLRGLEIVPMRINRFRLMPAEPAQDEWLLGMLNREGKALGTAFTMDANCRLHLVL